MIKLEIKEIIELDSAQSSTWNGQLIELKLRQFVLFNFFSFSI